MTINDFNFYSLFNRRKSFETSTINFAACLEGSHNDVGELDKGNVELLMNPKLLSVNSIIGKGGFGTVIVGLWGGLKLWLFFM